MEPVSDEIKISEAVDLADPVLVAMPPEKVPLHQEENDYPEYNTVKNRSARSFLQDFRQYMQERAADKGPGGKPDQVEQDLLQQVFFY
jgi:hypothetical protein